MFQFQSVIPFSYTFQLPVAAWGAAGAISQPTLSPTFVAGGYTFQLKVSAANTSNFQESVCAALELKPVLIAPPFIKVCYNFSLQSVDGQVHGQCSGSKMFAAAGQASPMVEVYRSVWGRVASRGQLKLVVTITSLLPLPINISVDTGVSLPVSPQLPQAAASPVAAQSTSSSQQGSPQGFSAFGNATFSDCQILLKDGTRLHGHRVILALASPVFAAMWTSGTSEAVNQEVKMEATPAVATALVRSMYGLPITVTLQQIPELLALADMYEVPSVLEHFSAWLTAHNGQLDAAALASIIPAVRLCLAALSQKLSPEFRDQCTLQLAELVGHAAMFVPLSTGQGVRQLATCDTFKAIWAAEDVAALLKACCTAGHAAEGVKAANAWVRQKQAERQQHWASLLDGVDFKDMTAADMDGLRQQLKDDPTLILRMFTALLAKQLQV